MDVLDGGSTKQHFSGSLRRAEFHREPLHVLKIQRRSFQASLEGHLSRDRRGDVRVTIPDPLVKRERIENQAHPDVA